MCLSLMRGGALAASRAALQQHQKAVVQVPAATLLKPRIQQRLMSVLPSAQAAQHAAGGGGSSSSSSAEKSPDYDPLRDGPLRFLGYSNELGEAFGMLVPHHVVLATYVVAISYVLVDTLDKFSRARQSARETLSIAASAQVNPTVDASAATAAAFANANPADPPHLTKAEKAAKKETPDLTVANPSTAALNSSVASMAQAASSSSGSSSANGRPSVDDLQPSSVSTSSVSTASPAEKQPEQAEMFSEMMPLAGAAGGVWQSGQGSSSGAAAGAQQRSSSSSNKGVGAGLAQGLDDAAGMIDAAGFVSSTGGGAGSTGSRGGERGGAKTGGEGKKFYLTQEEENAALVVGGLKALDTVIWQMLASVMIPGFIIHQSVRLVAQALASPAGTKSMVMGASVVGRVVGAEAAAVLPTYIESALPVVLGLALIPIICHPIDSVVDKVLDATLRPVMRKYRLQLQATRQREGPL